jgi:integrase
MMLSAGENILWVATQMGHNDTQMLRRIYGRWIPEADPMAGSRAVEVFSKQNDSNMPATTRKNQ